MKKEKIKSPNLVIIGNIAYDIVDFSRVDATRDNIKTLGGACFFSTIPASFFYRVGMVGKIGNDIDINIFKKFNIDLSGIKKVDEPTTKFYTIWNSKDGQDRLVSGEVSKKMEVGKFDIPENFLGAKHFHLTTAHPLKQLELIEFIRNNTNATISVDTIDDFVNMKECREVFDKVDIAFIDREYKELLNCKAKTKIIKYGKNGCMYYQEGKMFVVHANIVDKVIDKTGAGDCLNGVFLNLLMNGIPEEEALKVAVDTATESVKQKGMLNFKKADIFSEREEI